MSTKSAQKGEFITLKEAAKISGYTSDYLGQLIRQGKLEGKQVFSNVSWVTTESALSEYMSDSKKSSSKKESGSTPPLGLSPERVGALYVLLSRAVLVIVGLFLLFLLYVLSVSIDGRLEETYIQNAEYEI